jgi:hypothetical protein
MAAKTTAKDHIRWAALTKYYDLMTEFYYPPGPSSTIQILWDCIKYSLDTFAPKRYPCSLEDKQYIFNTLQIMLCDGGPIPEIARESQESEDSSPETISRFFIYVAPPNDTTPGPSEVSSEQHNNTARISGACMMTLGEILEVCIKDNNENNPYILWPNISHRENTTHFDPKTMGWVEDDFKKLIEVFDVLRGELESQSTL